MITKEVENLLKNALRSGVTESEIIKMYPALGSALRKIQLDLVSEGNPIAQLARSLCHVLIVAKTGCGKTTLIKAILADSCAYFDGKCHWSVVTPKSDIFWDWGKYPESRVLTQLPIHSREWIDILHDRVGRAYALFSERNQIGQDYAARGQKPPEFDPAFLFIDEWYSLWDELKKLPRIEYEDDDGKIKTRKDTRGDDIIGWLRQIVSMGRASNCFLYLVGQSSNTTEIGFSNPARGNFSMVALGRRGSKNEVGYDSITRVLNDNWLFADRSRAKLLTSQLPSVIEKSIAAGDAPIVLINSGESRFWIMPDLSAIDDMSVRLPRGI